MAKIKEKGFTFIEMVVVIAVIGLVLPVLFSIIFTIFRQQVRIYRLTEVKRQGDYVLNVIENSLRNDAVKIYSGSPTDVPPTEICNAVTASQAIGYFQDKNSEWFQPHLESFKVASSSSTTSDFDLTNNKVRVESLTMTCARTAEFSPPIVHINFSICYNNNNSCTSARSEENVTLTYQTKVKLKSY
jgi:prepilin-type N-terminal cleavage/methylation domain-containing protein